MPLHQNMAISRHTHRVFACIPSAIRQPLLHRPLQSKPFTTTNTPRQHVTRITHSRNHASNNKAKVLPADQPVEEEILPGYDPDDFCPIDPGDIFNNRYQAIAKIGFGSVSTVWLAKDLKKTANNSHPYVTLKVSACGAYDQEEAKHELAVMRKLHDTNPKHKGFQYLRTYDDTFEVEGPVGTHVVLVQKPMREPLGQFRRRFDGDKLPPKILQGFLQYWLAALDYMHAEACIVHTDIKDDNILMTFEDDSVLHDFEHRQADDPMPYKASSNGRRIYQAHASFGRLKSFAMQPLLVDFGAAHRMHGAEYKLFPIQPRYYRAPEVILGAGWSYPADIWNLGVLAFTLLENHHLFHHVNTLDSKYDIKKHLAQMYALLGPVPKHMLQRIDGVCMQHFEPEAENDEGKMCDTPRAYFGGPYFDKNGHFLHPELVPENFTWEARSKSLADEDQQMFLRFVKKMIKWDPAERATAGELLKDEWLTQHNVVV